MIDARAEATVTGITEGVARVERDLSITSQVLGPVVRSVGEDASKRVAGVVEGARELAKPVVETLDAVRRPLSQAAEATLSQIGRIPPVRWAVEGAETAGRLASETVASAGAVVSAVQKPVVGATKAVAGKLVNVGAQFARAPVRSMDELIAQGPLLLLRAADAVTGAVRNALQVYVTAAEDFQKHFENIQDKVSKAQQLPGFEQELQRLGQEVVDAQMKFAESVSSVCKGETATSYAMCQKEVQELLTKPELWKEAAKKAGYEVQSKEFVGLLAEMAKTGKLSDKLKGGAAAIVQRADTVTAQVVDQVQRTGTLAEEHMKATSSSLWDLFTSLWKSSPKESEKAEERLKMLLETGEKFANAAAQKQLCEQAALALEELQKFTLESWMITVAQSPTLQTVLPYAQMTGRKLTEETQKFVTILSGLHAVGELNTQFLEAQLKMQEQIATKVAGGVERITSGAAEAIIGEEKMGNSSNLCPASCLSCGNSCICRYGSRFGKLCNAYLYETNTSSHAKNSWQKLFIYS